MKKLFSVVLCAAISSLPVLFAHAHEPRPGVSGAFNLTVGQRVEPAYDNEPNQFDLIVTNIDGTPADVTEITIDVDVLLLKEDQFDAKILKRARLTGEIIRDRTTPHRFNIPYMPTRQGAYGFVIVGTINGIHINEKYVCGNGSQHPNGNSFGCVESIQSFPNQKNKHKK